MSLLKSCKSAAWGVVCCGARTRELDFDPLHSEDCSHCSRTGTTATMNKNNSCKEQEGGIRRRHRDCRKRSQHQTPSTLGQGKDGYTDDELSEKITERIFFYDTILVGPQTGRIIYRRVLLDFAVDVDAISDEIHQVLDLPILTYRGQKVLLPNGNSVWPIGTLEVKWQFYDGKKKYKTKFVVIKDSHFDMLLGRSSIKRYKLWEVDSDIKRRLQYR
ncbi:uncharacterized protein BJX67DRAFT_347078 [Aspergillus lucknowensis]|uniref:Fungal-type protein kinase domain-containing protein n=1 Tax=Aspergillus lucknowensis TaxID=176173 RepID=A0ABR4LZE4_9EURO